MPFKPGDTDISAYILRMQASGAMGKSARRLRLLEHLIKAETSGAGGELKAYSIGLDVLDKTPDFDPRQDSSVRVEIGRLRSAIKLFEASEFADCRLVVDIPVGTFRPTISQRTSVADEYVEVPSPPHHLRRTTIIAATALLLVATVIAIMSFLPRDEETYDDHIAVLIDNFKGEPVQGSNVGVLLRQSLAHGKTVDVLAPIKAHNGDGLADFRFQGSQGVTADGKAVVRGELLDTSDGKVIWTKSITVPLTEDVSDRIANTISSELRIRLMRASKRLLGTRDKDTLTPEELFILATWVPGTVINAVEREKQRIELVEEALAITPDFGAALSVLAEKLAYLANVYGPDNTDDNLERAQRHARRAAELAPFNADVLFNVAVSLWHQGAISESLTMMKRVIELDENHALARFLSLVVPYTCAVPELDVLKSAIAFDDQLSRDNPLRGLTLTGIAGLHTHRGEYRLALAREEQAALIFENPYTFMRHAMLLNELGQPEEAAKIIRQQTENWPSIDPNHFAKVTIPRLCRESTAPDPFVDRYARLAAAMADRLEN